MNITDCSPHEWYQNEAAYLELLQDETNWNKVPLLNPNDLHGFKDLTLVRFRGMVQDMHGPEFYLEKFEVRNEETQEVVTRLGKYLDIASCGPNEVVEDQGSSVIRGERQAYVVISVPAVNDWALKIEEEQHKIGGVAAPGGSNSQEKRPLDDSPEPMDQTDSKRLCVHPTRAAANTVLSDEHLQNFPIPDSRGKVCHLKVYKDSEQLKLNSVCEFVGFLSLNPSLAIPDADEEMDDAEFQVHNPPPSLIPRLHCVSFKHLQHNNPLVTRDKLGPERMQIVWKELLILFTQLMCGDELAAEYLIYNLISEVYLRKDLLAIGKFALNISNIPTFENLDYVQELYHFIALLVTKSHYLGMSLENMNELTFVPKKDYNSNRLTSSILQLSANTHLVIDETKLTPGKLNAAGVHGVKAISEAIKNQKTTYDFTYYQIEFDCDISFMVLSEGKSLLPSDVHVVLQPDDMHLSTFGEIVQAAKHFLKPELLRDIRVYLTEARLVQYEITDEVHDLVQNEFVNMRQKGSVSAEDLHNLLVLARLVCIAQGKSTLDEESWKRTCSLEEGRKKRVAAPRS